MLSFLNERVFGLGIPLLLLVVGVYFFVALRGFFLRRPKQVFKLLMGNREERVSSQKALALALAGTLGVGNIVGVATAIRAGGAGAVFWMWISALCSMTLKYAETVLAVRHSTVGQGARHGGAMYYITKRLRAPALSVLFCLLCIFASFFIGNIVQVNAVAQAMSYSFRVPALAVGVAFLILTLTVTLGGAERILSVTYRVIPALSLGYLLLSLAVVVKNGAAMGGILSQIVTEAFSVRAVGGGFCGYGIRSAIRYGVARGLLSNEAGCGTAPIAHATATTQDAVKQGCMGILEVVVDTLLLCSATAFVILLCQDRFPKADGMLLALLSYGRFFGRTAQAALSVAVACFALASIVGWSFYATECIGYLSKSKRVKQGYLLIYAAVCAVSPFAQGEWVWLWSDFLIYAMTALNVVCLFLLRRDVVSPTKTAFFSLYPEKKQKKATE